MRIRTTITMKSPQASMIAEKVALSLAPDNFSGMHTKVVDGIAQISFTTQKITTLIATVDDLLMNARIAEEVVEKTDK
ncbi:MAG: KEOPS complex subunit Pcc1 [Methanomethylovorans sp.]|uniref:KEOPS complex subunit Pcc1 n=1 Tax=Methanomethylovorans sp. TaxID=2758717 RepID=UPI000A6726A9|nr:KEOPS complex subunit Pcc1 [Methanomethylovorans sp.]